MEDSSIVIWLLSINKGFEYFFRDFVCEQNQINTHTLLSVKHQCPVELCEVGVWQIGPGLHLLCKHGGCELVRNDTALWSSYNVQERTFRGGWKHKTGETTISSCTGKLWDLGLFANISSCRIEENKTAHNTYLSVYLSPSKQVHI